MPQTQHSFSFEYNRAVSFLVLYVLFQEYRRIVSSDNYLYLVLQYNTTPCPNSKFNYFLCSWFWLPKNSTLQLLLLNFVWCSLQCLLLLNLSLTMLLQFVTHPSFWLCSVLSPWQLTKTRAKLSLKTEPSTSLMSLCYSSSVLLFSLC